MLVDIKLILAIMAVGIIVIFPELVLIFGVVYWLYRCAHKAHGTIMDWWREQIC